MNLLLDTHVSLWWLDDHPSEGLMGSRLTRGEDTGSEGVTRDPGSGVGLSRPLPSGDTR